MKKPNEWLSFVERLGGAERVSLVGPLFNEKFEVTEPTIFVDGGARFRRTDLEKFPCISVGDGDSGGVDLDVRLPEAKDFSDLGFVLSELPSPIRNLRMVGFWGGRFDHMLANFGEVQRFLSERSGGLVEFENDGKVQAVGFNGRLERKISGVFSVMVFEKTALEITGACRYPLTPKKVLSPASSHGLSNFGEGLVRLESDTPAFLIMA